MNNFSNHKYTKSDDWKKNIILSDLGNMDTNMNQTLENLIQIIEQASGINIAQQVS